MDTTFVLIVGGTTSFDDVVQKPAQTVVVNNFSNQWVELPGLATFVPPYWLGATFAAGGTNRASAKFNSPTGIPQAATIAAQNCSVIYMELAIQPNPGQPITVRAPSTEWRNPKEIINSATNSFVGPVAFGTDFSYTVPAGRRARVDTAQCMAEISASDGSGSGTQIGCFIGEVVGASTLSMISANIWTGTVQGARADVALAASVEFSAGTVLQGVSGNPRGAGVSLRVEERWHIIEGDA